MNDIDDYLRANRDAFTREALTKRLVDAGHDPAAIEDAWSRIGSETTPAGPIAHWAPSDAPPTTPTGTAGLGTRLLVVLAILVYGGAIALAGIAITIGGGVSVLMIVYIVAMLFGLAHTVRRLGAAPTRGTGWAPIWVAVGISVVIFVGLSGVCLAALGPAANLTGTRIL